MEKNFFWKGGIAKHEFGYVLIKTDKFPEIPRTKRGYIKRANLVWFIHTKEIIKMPYILHHIDKNPENDNFENLQKMTFINHAKLEDSLRLKTIEMRYV